MNAALAKGYEVVAISRNVDKITVSHANLTKVQGDFHNAASMAEAVKGVDAVIITAAPQSLSALRAKPDYYSCGTQYIIDALKGSNTRLIVLSAQGAGTSRETMPWFLRVLIVDWPGFLHLAFTDHTKQEMLVEKSDFTWVIARPSRLTDGPATNKVVKETELKKIPMSISRADLANFLVDSVVDNTYVGKKVLLGAT